jgi:hypothetical protein
VSFFAWKLKWLAVDAKLLNCHAAVSCCSIREEKVAQALGADKEKMEKALHDAMEWLDANQSAEVGRLVCSCYIGAPT